MSAVRELTIALIKAGMDPVEATILIARAGVEMAPPTDTRKPGARRQAAYRERHKASLNVTEVTLEKVTESVTKRHEALLSDAASLSKKEKKEIKTKEKRESRASQIPEGWRPDERRWQEAIARLGSGDRADAEIRKFTNHALSKGRVCKNWNAAWDNWVDRALEWNHGNGTSNHRTAGAAGPAQTGADTIVAGMGRLAERVRERQLAERQNGIDPAGSDDADFGTAGYDPAAHRRAV